MSSVTAKNAKAAAKSKDGNIDETQHQVPIEEALRLAQGHHQTGNYVLAFRTYRDILRAVPDHYPTTQYYGALLFQSGDYTEAEIYMKKAVESSPHDTACLNNYGGALTKLGRYEEALEIYDRALKADPAMIDALNNKAYTLWLMGRYEENEALVRKTVEKFPKNITALSNLGMTLSRLGRGPEALEVWRRASEIAPQDPRVWTNWGNTLREMGRIQASEQKCRKAVELNPKNPEALNNLANALRDLGKQEEAEALYRKATNLKPDYFEAHNNMALALLDQNRFEDAAAAARYAVAFNPNFAPAYASLSTALREQGDYNQAFAAVQKAVTLEPDLADAYLEMADILLMADRLDDAEAALQEAFRREKEPSYRAYMKLAAIRERQLRPDEAIESIDKAIELNPEMPLLWMYRAQTHHMSQEVDEALRNIDKALEMAPELPMLKAVKAEMLITVNRNDEAEALTREAMQKNPNLPAPYATLVTMGKIGPEDGEEFQKMLQLREQLEERGLHQGALINFALSEAYEQVKDYDKAFFHLQRANDFKRRAIPYNAAKVPVLYEASKRAMTPEFLKKFEGLGCESDLPVFIVGMPRSGTTLTEQIISSHPDVFGAGELPEINKIRQDFAFNPANAREMGEEYVRRILIREKEGKAKRITDKMPGNYSQVGVIASILPNAKIIHCRRDPIDTCLSCYKQNFARGQYWSYNLEELAAEYLRYLDIMEHWRKVLPGRVLDIDYEDTVGQPEEQARKLIEYIGLPWNEACLKPHEQKRAVLTASKAQVTKPIYKSSVQKWKKYEQGLQPLVRILKPEEALPAEEKA